MSMTDMPDTGVAGARVTPGRWIRKGWDTVVEDLGNFVLMALIAAGLTAVIGFTVVGYLVVAGPFAAGLFIAVKRRMLEGRTDLMDVFAGFNRFVDTLLLGLVVTLFSLIGLAFCVIPFFIVGAIYVFAVPFLVDRKLSFWEAMESSRRLVTPGLAGYTAFFFLLCLLNLVGLLLAGVGVLITLPVSFAAIAVAYKETVGLQPVTIASTRPVVIP